MLPIMILLGGATATAALYVPPAIEWYRKGDTYALGVTALAAAGTFLPFLGFAAMFYSMRS